MRRNHGYSGYIPWYTSLGGYRCAQRLGKHSTLTDHQCAVSDKDTPSDSSYTLVEC